MTRWEELAQLRDGWLDGSGRKITNEALRQAKLIAAQKGDVRIYPTETGGVLLENGEFSWEVKPDGSLEVY